MKKNDYHNYVIKDGKLIGEFEKMYQDCPNPWPETEKDLENNPVSKRTIELIKKYKFKKLFSVGSGKGLHANWLMKNVNGLKVEGCEISRTAIDYSKKHYPKTKVVHLDIKDFSRYDFKFDVLLLRECLWYMLEYWTDFIKTLKKKYKGKYIIIELTFYDYQKYGREYFDGPNDLVKKFPFSIIEVLRHHVTREQKEGMILIFGKII